MRSCFVRILSLLFAALVLPLSALGYVYDENVSYYESMPEIQEYMKNHAGTLTCYNVKDNESRTELYQRCFDRLETLGYNTGDNQHPYYTYDSGPTVSLFAQQMGLGDCEDGWKMSALFQAVLLTEGYAQPAVIPAVKHRDFCNENGKVYTLKELVQAKTDEKVCWTGKVTDVQYLAGVKTRYTISCDAQAFVVEYSHPARGTVFLKGDNVVVYGRISDEAGVHIMADMIAYSK